MATIHQILKQKLQVLKPDDYALSSTFSEAELSELGHVAEDQSAELDDRIIAARALYNIAENRVIRAERSRKKFHFLWQSLEHTKQEQRNISHTTDYVLKKLGNADGLEGALEKLLELARAKKESR